MKITHIGPPLALRGGPSGYLLQLANAARSAGGSAHDVRFPAVAPTVPAMAPAAPGVLRNRLRRLRRVLFGSPRQFRPSLADLRAHSGSIDRSIKHSRGMVVTELKESFSSAQTADVLFTHDPFAAEAALARRTDGQQVWMMCHAPFPIALYLSWSWAVPEMAWPELLELPDVRTWIDWELALWSKFDRIILPCCEAGEELVRVDARFGPEVARADHVLTGASRSAGPPQRDRALLRRRWGLPEAGRVGLFVGNAEPYRGLDALFEGLRRASVPGVLAVAGPPVERLEGVPNVHALGRVKDVDALLATVDFVVNVNRFCLFDLSTIEAAEAGKPTLLHETGGNKTFRRLGLGCHMLKDLAPATVGAGLDRMFSVPAEELDAMGRASRECYEQFLTPERMWAEHIALYDRATEQFRGG